VAPYEQAFNRIRAEFTEMPGMRLTPGQVERLSGVGGSICRLVLDDLVRAGFLSTDLGRVPSPASALPSRQDPAAGIQACR
jgi:hypothetical protein